ncbi:MULTISPECIES: type II toxin-antitoxin system RelE/ParE family toxin [unclassified Phyllobacterium]
MKRLSRILAFLDRASVPEDLSIPGWRLHRLQGSLEGFWSISVSGN